MRVEIFLKNFPQKNWHYLSQKTIQNYGYRYAMLYIKKKIKKNKKWLTKQEKMIYTKNIRTNIGYLMSNKGGEYE